MSIKYVELELDEEPDYTPEEFAALPADERLELVKRGFSNMKKTMFMLSFAVIKYGDHDKSCTDPHTCTCSYSAVEDLAMTAIRRLENEMANEGLIANDITVN